MVINFYRSATAYTAITVAELGEISSGGTGYQEAFNQIGACDVGVFLNDYINPDSINATLLNFPNDPSGNPIKLSADVNMQDNFVISYFAVNRGFLDFVMNLGNTQVAHLRASYDDVFGTNGYSKVFLAHATVNGHEYLGFLGINDRAPQSASYRKYNYFAANSTWSAKILEEARRIDTSNPYWEGGYSEPGGGDPAKQNWDETSDVVTVDPLPSETDYAANSTGLVTIFNPTPAQLRSLATIMWGQGFFEFMHNLVENISDMFISLAILPFTVEAGSNATVTWFGFETAVTLRKIARQYYEINMGTIYLDGTDGFATDSVLDYSPYSKLGIFLPFIGYEELDIDECRGGSIQLIYRIDALSGSCLAIIRLQGRDVYQFSGNCLTQLPLTSIDAQTLFTNAVNIGIAAAGAGATGAVASAGDALAAEKAVGGAKLEVDQAQRAATVSNAQGSLALATANGAMGIKPNFKKSGAVSGATSMFGVKQPYLFLTTPRQSMPDGYNDVCGFPCNMGGRLGDFSGYTVVEDIRLNGLIATAPEVEEIYQLLKSGVII